MWPVVALADDVCLVLQSVGLTGDDLSSFSVLSDQCRHTLLQPIVPLVTPRGCTVKYTPQSDPPDTHDKPSNPGTLQLGLRTYPEMLLWWFIAPRGLAPGYNVRLMTHWPQQGPASVISSQQLSWSQTKWHQLSTNVLEERNSGRAKPGDPSVNPANPCCSSLPHEIFIVTLICGGGLAAETPVAACRRRDSVPCTLTLTLLD